MLLIAQSVSHSTNTTAVAPAYGKTGELTWGKNEHLELESVWSCRQVRAAVLL